MWGKKQLPVNYHQCYRSTLISVLIVSHISPVSSNSVESLTNVHLNYNMMVIFNKTDAAYIYLNLGHSFKWLSECLNCRTCFFFKMPHWIWKCPIDFATGGDNVPLPKFLSLSLEASLATSLVKFLLFSHDTRYFTWL